MKLENVSFFRINHTGYVMKRTIGEAVSVEPENMLEVMRKAEQKATVHLYPITPNKVEPKRLIELNSWPHAQFYLAISRNRIYYCVASGETEERKQAHNYLVSEFLADPELQRKTPTAVLVTSRKDIIAYRFHENYAYVDHDLADAGNDEGDIEDWSLGKRLDETELPSSYRTENNPGDGIEIFFSTRGYPIPIFSSTKQDISFLLEKGKKRRIRIRKKK